MTFDTSQETVVKTTPEVVDAIQDVEVTSEVETVAQQENSVSIVEECLN